jgi:two-component system, OmpR family, sensor kinase
MVKSLRWRLQIWYALVMILVVGGLLLTLYQRIYRTTIAQIDEQLEGAGRFLEATLRAYPRRFLERQRPEFPLNENLNRVSDKQTSEELVADEIDPFDEFFGPLPNRSRRPPPRDDESMNRDAPPRDGPPGRDGPPRGGPLMRPVPMLELSQQMQLLPVNREQDRPYFGIWRGDGSLLQSEPDLSQRKKPVNERNDARFAFAQLDEETMGREVTIRGPNTSMILVGRSIQRELNELHRLAWQIAGLGAVALAVSLGGGWLIAKRIWRPLGEMSATAEKISGDQLSERINVAGLDQELQPLGDVLNAMFARLQAAFNRQTQFTSDASHELRTPLTVLRTNLELSLSRARTPEEYQETLRTCLTATGRMKRLIEDLLTLARADQKVAIDLTENVDLGQIVSDVVKSYQRISSERNVQLAYKSDLLSDRGKPFIVRGQESLLSRVIGNLIENSLRYTPDHGEIELNVRRHDTTIEITVSDTGCGIPREELPRVFQRFYRVDTARTRESGGFGLGLAICQNIIEQHRGTITAESEIGRGTTMRIRLPAS